MLDNLTTVLDQSVKTSLRFPSVFDSPPRRVVERSENLIPLQEFIARKRKQAEEEWERQIKESVNSTFKEKGADAAFVVDKFENYSGNQESIQESTQNTAVLEEYQPFEVEPGTVVDGVMIDATDDPELDVNEQENHRECTDPSELDSYKQKWQCECNEALDEYLKADEALKQEKPLLPIIIRGDQIPD